MLTAGFLRVWAPSPYRAAGGARTRSLRCVLPQDGGDPSEALGEIVVVDTGPAVGRDRGDDRMDPAQGVGAAGRRVGVGRFPQGATGEVDGAVAIEVGPPAELHDGAGVEAPGAGGDVLPLLVAAAGD